MKARILPPAEWQRLERTQIPPLFPYVRPEDIAVVVMEDEGKVIACMTVLRATHLEGAWIDPAHRNAGVTRGLLRLAVDVAKGWGNAWAFGGAADDQMSAILGRLGGVPMSMSIYALPLEDECRKQ